MLININSIYGHVTNVFWPPFFNRFFLKILFQKCKCIHVLQPNFIEKKNPLGKWFFKIWSHDCFCKKEKLFFGPHFTMLCVLILFSFLFWFMVVLGVYKYGASFVPKFLWESTQKRLSPSGPLLCTNGSKE